MQCLRAAAAIATLSMPAWALAQTPIARDADVQLNAGVGHSDNVTRDPDDAQRADFRWLGLRMNLGTERRRLTGDLSADLQLRRYEAVPGLEEDRETFGTLDGNAAFAVVPERFEWLFLATAGQTRTDPLEAPSPDNREEVRILATGPSLTLPVARAMSLRLAATTSKRKFEESDQLDSTSDQITVGLERALGSVSRGAIVFVRDEVEFDDVSDSYDMSSAYVSYTRDFSSGAVELRVGAADVSASAFEGDTTPTASFTWSRGVGTRSQLSVWASKELTDPGELFRAGGVPGLAGSADDGSALESIDVGDARLDGIVLAPEPLERSSIGAAFRVDGRRGTMAFSVSTADEEFQSGSVSNGGGDLTNDYHSVQASYRRELNRRWSATVDVRSVDRDFDVAQRNNRDFRGRLAARRSLSRRLGMEVLFERNVRSGDIDSSDENVYALSVGYDIGP